VGWHISQQGGLRENSTVEYMVRGQPPLTLLAEKGEGFLPPRKKLSTRESAITTFHSMAACCMAGFKTQEWFAARHCCTPVLARAAARRGKSLKKRNSPCISTLHGSARDRRSCEPRSCTHNSVRRRTLLSARLTMPQHANSCFTAPQLTVHVRRGLAWLSQLVSYITPTCASRALSLAAQLAGPDGDVRSSRRYIAALLRSPPLDPCRAVCTVPGRQTLSLTRS